MKKLLIIFVLLISQLNAQTEDNIFPGLLGQQLLDSLVWNYKTSTTLSQGQTKDIMYSIIYNHDDSLTCVYTDFTMYIDPSMDPSQAAYNNGNGINQEHTWPRAKGASSGNAEKDMHHLFPTRVDVNQYRGNYPFDEIPDIQTDTWWWLDFSISTIPVQFINEYSELDNAGGSRFEPREDHKGNVARAMFYFYTMYETEANAADPQFFQIQKDVLWQWHLADPPDSNEIIRTNQIATYQDNKPNPFVLDTTLVERAYFSTSEIVNMQKPAAPEKFVLFQNFPNPFNPQTTIQYYVSTSANIQLRIYNIQGRLIRSTTHSFLKKGYYEYVWNGENEFGEMASSGVYIYTVLYSVSPKSGMIWTDMKKMILLH